MVRIRIWGGGIYEHDAFYEECDKQGILVWQDFMWACAAYPLDAALLESSKKEIEAQVVRLRHHASIALWCGNNEVEMLANYYKWDVNGPCRQADSLYLETMPEIVKRVHPGSIYWVSSPWTAKGEPANDLTAGDVHQWSVWHMELLPYQKYGSVSGSPDCSV
jgi:beta-mannosidase